MRGRDARARRGDERQVLGVGGVQRGEVRAVLARGQARLPLLRLLHVQVLETREQLPDCLEVEGVLCHLELERMPQQRERLLLVRGPHVRAHLAKGAERVRRQRRLLAHRRAEDAQRLLHVARRLREVLELLVRLADGHVRLGDDRRVELL
eukprot:539521-Prymnesium_polylepis.1